MTALTDGVGPARAGVRSQDDLAELFCELAAVGPDSAAGAGLVAAIVERRLDLARSVAQRYARRGEPIDDLVQVACVGLLKAVRNFDPARRIAFDAYAVPTMTGEVKRYFRDATWGTHVPRRVQELVLDVNRAAAELPQSLGRTPSRADIAGHLGVTTADVGEAGRGGLAYRADSLSSPEGTAGSPALERALAVPPVAYDVVENRLTLKVLIRQLPERQQRILGLRFFDELSQSEIAARVGVSQMHVSRLLASALRRLHEGMTA